MRSEAQHPSTWIEADHEDEQHVDEQGPAAGQRAPPARLHTATIGAEGRPGIRPEA